MKKEEIIAKVKTLNLPKNSYVVFGSCPLALAEIREAKDIDLLVSREVFAKLKKDGWQFLEKSPNDKPLVHDIFEAHDNWNFSSYYPTLEQLLGSATIVDEIPFASLDEVRKWKVSSGRPKDLADIELIDNHKNMKTIDREIVSALIFSKDGKLFQGMKNPKDGGVYSDCWHIPGGGIDSGEDKITALIREVREETGIEVPTEKVEFLDDKGRGESEKILKESGERVLCKMKFNVYKIVLDQNANDIAVSLDDDLVKYQWTNLTDLKNIKLTPPSIELGDYPFKYSMMVWICQGYPESRYQDIL